MCGRACPRHFRPADILTRELYRGLHLGGAPHNKLTKKLISSLQNKLMGTMELRFLLLVRAGCYWLAQFNRIYLKQLNLSDCKHLKEPFIRCIFYSFYFRGKYCRQLLLRKKLSE
jgi:hypothetical protein